VILDSFSLSNFEAVGDKTLTIPKVISSIKSFIEDLPQFVIQVIFILFYSKSDSSDKSGVVVSIMLGFISFMLSINHALYAKTSSVEI
jgi:hypothetical protein